MRGLYDSTFLTFFKPRMMTPALKKFQLLKWHLTERNSSLGAAVLCLNGHFSAESVPLPAQSLLHITDVGLTDCGVLFSNESNFLVQLHH